MTNEKSHPNSRIITIYRAESLLAKTQGSDVKEYMNLSKKSIGSYWEGPNIGRVATGLDFWEQDILLPYIINCDPSDRQFRKEVELFYHEISTKVPPELGVQLEIGLKEDNTKPISQKNLPLNVSDYIKWRHHKGHPKVAANRTESDGNNQKEYYIFDPTESQTKKNEKLREQDEAMQIYLTVKKEPEKVDWMLTLMEIDPRSFSAKSEEEKMALKLAALRKKAEEKPKDFKKIHGSEHLQTMYLIEKLSNLKVLTKIGSKYINSETKETIGHNMEEAISYFIDDSNEQAIMLMKAHMQEAEKKPYNPAIKTTVLTDKQRYGGANIR